MLGMLAANVTLKNLNLSGVNLQRYPNASEDLAVMLAANGTLTRLTPPAVCTWSAPAAHAFAALPLAAAERRRQQHHARTHAHSRAGRSITKPPDRTKGRLPGALRRERDLSLTDPFVYIICE